MLSLMYGSYLHIFRVLFLTTSASESQKNIKGPIEERRRRRPKEGEEQNIVDMRL